MRHDRRPPAWPERTESPTPRRRPSESGFGQPFMYVTKCPASLEWVAANMEVGARERRNWSKSSAYTRLANLG